MMILVEKKELLLMQIQMKKDLKRKKVNLLKLTLNIMIQKKNQIWIWVLQRKNYKMRLKK